MGRFESPGQAQRFLAAHDQINTTIRPRRYRLIAKSYRHARADAFDLSHSHARARNDSLTGLGQAAFGGQIS